MYRPLLRDHGKSEKNLFSNEMIRLIRQLILRTNLIPPIYIREPHPLKKGYQIYAEIPLEPCTQSSIKNLNSDFHTENQS